MRAMWPSWSHVPNYSTYGLCGRKATLNLNLPALAFLRGRGGGGGGGGVWPISASALAS